jgi:hypothetical protein
MAELEPENDTTDFRARLTNPNIITAGLRGVANGKREQHVQVEVTPNESIRFIATDPTKALQACASIKDKLFEEWYIKDEETVIAFRVNVAILLDCLTMGTGTSSASTGLLLEYKAAAGTLTLQLMEPDSTTECVIRTLADDIDDEGVPDFASAFRASSTINKAIILSAPLRDAFSDLAELPGASQMTVAMNPTEPELRLSAEGEHGVYFVDFKRSSFDLFEVKSPVLFAYKLSLMERALKPLADSEKTFIRVNGDGILSLQHLIRQAEGQKTYVDFYVLANEDGNLAGEPDEPDLLQGGDD